MKICETRYEPRVETYPRLISGHIYQNGVWGIYIYTDSKMLYRVSDGQKWSKLPGYGVSSGQLWEDVTDQYCLQKI